jgi:hypothetical protein
MPAYVVYPVDCDRDLFGIALGLLHETASAKPTAVGKRPASRSREARQPRAQRK